MYRGGNWNNGSNAGVFYLNGNNSRSNANTNIGFRAALPVEATGDTEQTAQAGRCLLCGQKADPDPMAWLP